MSVTEEKYSQKFEDVAGNPKYRGAYYQEDASEKGMALVEAKYKDTKLYWLVDVLEDRIYSAKYFSYGGKISRAIGETLCTMVKGLTLEEACSLLGTDVESLLRDHPETPAVPESKLPAFAAVEEMLKIAKETYPAAKGVALASSSVKDGGGGAGAVKSLKELSMAEQAWLGLSKEEQKAQIDLVLDETVRPALMNDGGNVQVLDVIDGEKVLIQYQGACGSCGASLGSTLSFMEQTLRQKIYNELMVVPNM